MAKEGSSISARTRAACEGQCVMLEENQEMSQRPDFEGGGEGAFDSHGC